MRIHDGDLHLRGTCNAQFNQLFLRSGGWKFILGVKDTDVEHSIKKSEEAVLRIYASSPLQYKASWGLKNVAEAANGWRTVSVDRYFQWRNLQGSWRPDSRMLASLSYKFAMAIMAMTTTLKQVAEKSSHVCDTTSVGTSMMLGMEKPKSIEEALAKAAIERQGPDGVGAREGCRQHQIRREAGRTSGAVAGAIRVSNGAVARETCRPLDASRRRVGATALNQKGNTLMLTEVRYCTHSENTKKQHWTSSASVAETEYRSNLTLWSSSVNYLLRLPPGRLSLTLSRTSRPLHKLKETKVVSLIQHKLKETKVLLTC